MRRDMVVHEVLSVVKYLAGVRCDIKNIASTSPKAYANTVHESSKIIVLSDKSQISRVHGNSRFST
jgi:hypothetical protein